MLRKIRIVAATLCFTIITLLFLDFTGTIHSWFGWLAKIQLLPAILALNVGVVAALIILTLLLGRVYCSVICPLGVMQDLISWAAGKRKKNRFTYSPAKTWLRYGVLAVFIATLVAGFGAIALLVAPYSAYGRIAQNLLAPLWGWGNNLLAYVAERVDSYAFYSTEVVMGSIGTFAVAVATLIIVGALAWRGGRTYCNTICPVGTVLGAISRFSLLKPIIDTDKCIDCKRCARNCKASCIDVQTHSIDYSRCVACMDCLEMCSKNAIHYTRRTSQPKSTNVNTAKCKTEDSSRRNFIVGAGLLAASAAKAQEMKLDGGYATILDKKAPARQNAITPAGSLSAHNMAAHCTGCQLCVAVCPTKVLRPSADLKTFMQPTMSYEVGYCRPECNKCSEVCPAGAIKPISVAEKSSTQIGHAVWIKDNCIVLTDDVDCGNCERHCPAEAITMIRSDVNNPKSRKIPAVNVERCIGCGACENLCPARPFSAIYVEGHSSHRTI
ncbi:MAG: 4Fe-4S dicluster domain-containing protein [Alistipes sp.]|nr:4Fe-4S dicluster domain-containing protein [Alistipes sp.]